MIMVLLNAVTRFAFLGYLIQAKIQGVVIPVDIPTSNIVAQSMLFAFYFPAIWVAFLA